MVLRPLLMVMWWICLMMYRLPMMCWMDQKRLSKQFCMHYYRMVQTKEIWKSGKIDYEVNDKEFTKTMLAEKVDTGKFPESTKFTFAEINYDKDENINGKHNEDLKEKIKP